MNKDWNNMTDNLEGKLYEAAGKITDDEQLELKGKMKIIKGDIKNKSENLKEMAAEKANDMIDRMRKDK
jgi:uncharacterized protein YjbJ (UPF0337 family)